MRVSQNMLLNMSLNHMNGSLTELVRLTEMGYTEKRINNPSDDPAGAAIAIGLRAQGWRLEGYKGNVKTAKGWLGLGDSILTQASTLISDIKAKAEQGATSTQTAEQRRIIADQIRQFMHQMVSLSNTEYTGKSIFAGHKIDSNAYEEVLHASTLDDAISDAAVERVQGSAERSIKVEFLDSGTVGGTADLQYRYSDDGGETWTTQTLAAGSRTLACGGADMTLADGTAVTGRAGDADGSAFIIRPSARYLGDDQDGVSVGKYGAQDIDARAEGNFRSGTVVRIDANATLPGSVQYSYSLDGGQNWVSGLTSNTGRLSLPGGILELTPGAGNTISQGDQFTLDQRQARININISADSQVEVNNVGKSIFGGLYQQSGASYASADPAGDDNLFEALGELIGYLETNDREGIGDSLDKLGAAHERLLAGAADTGARLQRVNHCATALDTVEDNVKTNLSGVEDADLLELTTKTAQARLIYQTVLKTSTDVLNLSILNYL